MAPVMQRLNGRLREMLGAGARLSRVLISDKSAAVYARSGRVLGAYDDPVTESRLKLFRNPDANQQTPEKPDLILHEIAASRIRNVL